MIDKAAVLDPVIIEQLREVGGSELLERMVSQLLEDGPSRLTNARAALEGHRLASMADYVHRLRGGSAALGLGRVVAACEALETSSKPTELPELLRALEDAWARGVEALAERLRLI